MNSILEKAIEQLTGLKIDALRAVPLTEIRKEAERRYKTYKPISNKQDIISHEEVEKRLDEALRY